MKATCTCAHEGQDAVNGKQQRVFNPTTKQSRDDTVQATCTVCGATRNLKKK